MNNNLKVVLGTLTGIMIGCLTVVGASQTIQAIQNTEIKVSLDGQFQTFKDETTGETQYPITYHDRTYLPLRNVAQLAGLSVDYDSNTNTALLDSKDTEIEDSKEYFWNYKTITKHAYLLNTSAYDEIHDKYIILKRTEIGQNTLASLVKRYGEDNGIMLFYKFCEGASYFGYGGGDDTTFIDKETNYDEENIINLSKPLNIKFVQVHEQMYNDLWWFIKKPEEYMNELRMYKERIDENDSSFDDYYSKKIRKSEEYLKELNNDSTILSIRQKCDDFDDLTMEEKAHCAKYTTGYWDRPQDANYSLNRILIMNGYNYSKESYNEHGRAKKIKVTVNEKEYYLDLADTPECQIFDINYKTNEIFKPLNVTIEVLEKYTGTSRTKNSYSYVVDEEVYISDIQFDVDASVFAGGR